MWRCSDRRCLYSRPRPPHSRRQYNPADSDTCRQPQANLGTSQHFDMGRKDIHLCPRHIEDPQNLQTVRISLIREQNHTDCEYVYCYCLGSGRGQVVRVLDSGL